MYVKCTLYSLEFHNDIENDTARQWDDKRQKCALFEVECVA